MYNYKSPRAVSVRVRKITPGNVKNTRSRSPVELHISYWNHTRTPVTCVLRNGYSFQIPPEPHVGNGDFTISVTYAISRSVKTDIHHLLNGVDDNSSFELKAMAAAITGGDCIQDASRTVFRVEFTVSLAELRDNGGSMYLRELDLLASVVEPTHVPHHPFNERTQLRNLAEDNDAVNNPDTMAYYVRIVDNQGVFGDHYLNLNGEVYRVPANIDPSIDDGVYLITTSPIKGNQPTPPPRTERISFKEAKEKLRLFNSYAEAETLGDVFAERERELKEAAQKRDEELRLLVHEHKLEEHRLRVEKQQRDADFEIMKAKFEDKKRRWEEEKAEEEDRRRRRQEDFKLREMELTERATRLKAERDEWDHHRQMESMRRKDYYDDRSYRRKDFSEFFKYIPVVTTAIATLYVAYLKAKQ